MVDDGVSSLKTGGGLSMDLSLFTDTEPKLYEPDFTLMTQRTEKNNTLLEEVIQAHINKFRQTS